MHDQIATPSRQLFWIRWFVSSLVIDVGSLILALPAIGIGIILGFVIVPPFHAKGMAGFGVFLYPIAIGYIAGFLSFVVSSSLLEYLYLRRYLPSVWAWVLIGLVGGIGMLFLQLLPLFLQLLPLFLHNPYAQTVPALPLGVALLVGNLWSDSLPIHLIGTTMLVGAIRTVVFHQSTTDSTKWTGLHTLAMLVVLIGMKLLLAR